MADQFQIPQRTPPQATFQPPTDLVNAYLSRQQQQQQNTVNALPAAINDYLDYQLKQQQLKAGAFEAGGPYLMNMLYGQGQQASTTPQGQTAGAVQTPPQTQAGAVPQGAVAGQPPQETQPSQAIQASINMGHPDFTGHLSRIQQLQNQMAGVQGMGKYGREQQQGIGQQLQAEKSAMDAEQLPAQYDKTQADLKAANAKFATPQQGAAIASGDPAAVAGAYGGTAPIEAYNNAAQKQMEVKKTVAGEISKQGQSSQQIGQIRQLYSDLEGALSQNTPSLTGNLSGKLNQVSGGRMGSSSAADVLNAANPLATALNTELSRRFNSGEVQLLSDSLIPHPMDTPAYAAKKMTRLNHMISAMESGNEQNVMNVANAITGGKINATIMPTRNQPTVQGQQAPQAPPITSKAQYDALPNGASYTWNGQHHIKGKS